MEARVVRKGKEYEQRHFTARCTPWKATWTEEGGESGAAVVTVKLNPLPHPPFTQLTVCVVQVEFRPVT